MSHVEHSMTIAEYPHYDHSYLAQLKSRFDAFETLIEGVVLEEGTLANAYEKLGPRAIAKRLMVHPSLIGAAMTFIPPSSWPDIGIDTKLEHAESWYVSASIYEKADHPINKYKTKCVYSPGEE